MCKRNGNTVPIADKTILSIQECNALTGIGQNKLEKLLKMEGCPFLLKNGSKKMVIRTKLDEYLQQNQII